MLNINRANKTFLTGTPDEKHALCDVSLDLQPGEFLVVVGGNGCGKTTLLNAVAGVVMIDSGNIILGGKNVTNVPEFKRAGQIGRVFQDPMMGTVAGMSIEENMALAMRRGQRRNLSAGLNKSEKSGYRDMVAQLGLGLEDRMSARAGLLSGGQRQAITLLMATMKRPDILLLDEHTAALDPKTAKRVLSLSDELIRKHSLTTLMVTHNMNDAIRYGDRLVMMEGGQIIFEAQGEEKSSLTAAHLVERFEMAADM